MATSVSFASVLLDEVCLEGLDGITLQALWLRLEDRFECRVSESLKKRFWNIIIHLRDINFYLLPEPRADLVIIKRFKKKDGKYFVNDIGEEQFQSSIYPLHPVKNDYGSCQHYDTRLNINSEVKTTLDDVVNKWGNKLVIVGTIKARWRSLSPGSPPIFESLSKAQYCILENIGRTRYNGETTWKMMSVKGEPEDPKTMFYHRKILVHYNLVVKQPICIKTNVTTNSIILHLTRFNTPFISQEECVVKKIVDLIDSSPTKMIPFVKAKELIQDTLDTSVNIKKFLKLSEISKVISTTTVSYIELYPDAIPDQCINKANGSPIFVRVVKRTKSDNQNNQSHDQDDDEMAIDEEIKGSCYVGESLLHQAYNCVHEAGPTGITRIDLSKILGVDVLTARTLLRRLKARDNLQVILIEEKRQKKEFFVCPDLVKLRHVELESEMRKINEISETVQHNVPSEKQKSLKNLRLTNIILEEIRYRHIIHELSNLTKYCDRQQHALGVSTGVVDRRTILRIIKNLELQGLVRYHKIKLEPKYNSKLLSFICEPHIDTDHPFIQSIIEQAKLSVNTTSSGKKAIGLVKAQGHVKKFTCNSNKFLKTSVLHKFLFYILYNHQNKVVSNVETFSKYDEKFKDLLPCELSPVYEAAPPGYCFVPPLNKYSGWPEGWLVLADVFLCMPLYIFTQMVTIPVFPLLEEYLKHPIKRQILIKNAPNEIKNTILWKKSYIFSIVERLCFIGLVKFGQRVMKDKFRIYIYVNKVASILDTTSSGPCYHQVEEKEYKEEFFTFDSLDDIERYWSRLQYVCLNTNMGIPTSVLGKEITILSPERKLAEYLRTYSIKEAIETDIGSVPGDRRGAGGIDSSLYSHLKRSWGLNEFGVKTGSISRVDANTKGIAKLLRKKPKISRNVQMLVGNTVSSRAKGKIIKRTVKARQSKRVRKSEYDETDKIAVKNMATQRTYWSSKEDRIIQLAAIVCSIMGPKNLFGTVTRDMLYCITNIRDKTSVACRRRLLFLKKKKLTFRNMEIHMSEIKQNTNVMKQYSQLYKRLWVKENSPEYPNFIKDIQIHFIEFVQYLHRMIYNKEMASTFMALPRSLSEIHLGYHMYSSEIPVSENYTEPTVIDDISHSTAQSVIHMTLSTDAKNNVTSKRHALKVFLQFDEELLRTAIQKINSLGMAVKLKKIKQKHHVTSQLSSTYSLSQMYMYHLCSPTPYAIFPELYNNYKTIVLNGLKHIDCQNVDSGMVALLTDLSSLNVLDMKLNIPQHILIPDPRLCDRYNANNKDSTDTSHIDEKISNILTESGSAVSSIQVIESSTMHSQDVVVVNTCQLETNLKHNLNDVLQICTENVVELLNTWINDTVFEYGKESMSSVSQLFDVPNHEAIAEEMFAYIESKEIMGAFCADIKKQFSTHNKYLLHEILITLKNAKLIFRVGVKKLRWISYKYFKHWFIVIKEPFSSNTVLPNVLKRNLKDVDNDHSKRVRFSDESDLIESSVDESATTVSLKDELCGDNEIDMEESNEANPPEEERNQKSLEQMEDSVELTDSKVSHSKFMCPRIWMKLDGTLNYRNLWRWLGAILCYLINHPTVSLESLCRRFTFLFPFHVQLLVEMLVDMNCVKIFVIHKCKTSFWDDNSQYAFENATVLDEYADILVSIKENSLMRFSYYRGIAIDAKKSQDSTFSFEEVSQTNENISQPQDSAYLDKENTL